MSKNVEYCRKMSRSSLEGTFYGFKNLLQKILITIEKQSLLWINLHLERLTSALSTTPSTPHVFRDKTPKPLPHNGFESSSTPKQGTGVELYGLLWDKQQSNDCVGCHNLSRLKEMYTRLNILLGRDGKNIDSTDNVNKGQKTIKLENSGKI